MAIWLADPCWISCLSPNEFRSRGPFFFEQNFGVNTCPQFWDKNDFIAKLLSMVVARIAPNHLLQSHTNFFGILADLFHWLLLTKDYIEDHDVRSFDGDHPLDLLSHSSPFLTQANSRSFCYSLSSADTYSSNSSILANYCIGNPIWIDCLSYWDLELGPLANFSF